MKGEEVEVGRHIGNSGLHGQAPSADTDKVSCKRLLMRVASRLLE